MNRQDFNAAIASGLQRLLVLSLQNTPPADTIKLTASVWCDTIWPQMVRWDDADLSRIEVAFRILCRDCERWPSPRQFLDNIPKRSEMLKLADRLTPEEREAGRKKMAEVLATLTRRKTA